LFGRNKGGGGRAVERLGAGEAIVGVFYLRR